MIEKGDFLGHAQGNQVGEANKGENNGEEGETWRLGVE